MRNLIDQLGARHFVVLSLALMLVLGAVSAALGARDDEQAIRREGSEAEEAVLAEDDAEDDPNDSTRLERVATGVAGDNDGADTGGDAQLAQTNNGATDNDGVDTEGDALAAQTDNDGTDTDGVDTEGDAAAQTDNDGTDTDGVDTEGDAAAETADTGDDTE